MRIIICLIFLLFTFSCVSSYRTSNIQYLIPIKREVNKDEFYRWEEYTTYFELTLQSDSSFRFVKNSYSDCTSRLWCKSYGAYQLKQDSIFLHFEKAEGGRDAKDFVELFSDTTMTLPFSRCEIKLLGLELKNEACE